MRGGGSSGNFRRWLSGEAFGRSGADPRGRGGFLVAGQLFVPEPAAELRREHPWRRYVPGGRRLLPVPSLRLGKMVSDDEVRSCLGVFFWLKLS